MMRLYRKTYAKIDLEAIKTNIKNIGKKLPAGCKIMGVVKADAYGHGAEQVAKAVLEAGAGAIAVELAEEGALLREAGITAPLLVMGGANADQVELAVEHGLTQCVFDVDGLRMLDAAAGRQGRRAAAHIKCDTGMGRIGLRETEDFKTLLAAANELDNVVIDGIFTHFACADEEDQSFSQEQLDRFKVFLNVAADAGYNLKVHALNSAGGLWGKDGHFDYVRCGISIYGYHPSEFTKSGGVQLVPAMQVMSEISQIKTVEAGTPVGYGSTYVTPRKTTIATVQIGYGDGYNRLLSNKGRMIVKGKDGYAYANVIGRVCMDQTMIDVTEIEGVCQGDSVIAMGCAGDLHVTADDIAALCGTISYEVLLSYSKRVPRVYE